MDMIEGGKEGRWRRRWKTLPCLRPTVAGLQRILVKNILYRVYQAALWCMLMCSLAAAACFSNTEVRLVLHHLQIFICPRARPPSAGG